MLGVALRTPDECFRLRIHLGVLNIADRKYREWADVRGRPATDVALDRFTRPGRTVAANVKLDW
ncbi:MAG TPA: hypothetical protein VIL32_16215 [Steroidobacteraceae bacterium]